MTEIEKFKYLLDRGTFHFKPFFSDETVEAMPDITSLLTTIESLQDQLKTAKTEAERLWNIEDIAQSQKEEIEIYRSSLQSISHNSSNSGSFIAAQSALNKVERLREEKSR